MVSVKYYSAGVKEDIDCELSLSSVGNSSTLYLNSDKGSFEIHIKDLVELDDFHKFLTKKDKKIVLYCVLKQGKEYKGVRKIVWKNDNICVSVGGIRLELDFSVQELIIKAISSIKTRMG
jgi:hypothetical protein